MIIRKSHGDKITSEAYSCVCGYSSQRRGMCHKVKANIYDLILLDYMMPQMDGIDTIRELKKGMIQFHIPVIALTADVTKGIEQTFLREGFCAYLSKPVMWSKLEDLLMKYLRDDLVFIREDLKEEQRSKMKNLSS